MEKKKFSSRLLLAIDLPRFAREAVGEARKRWRKKLKKDVKWLPPGQLRLNIRSLGEMPVSKSKALSKRLEQFAKNTPSFQLTVDSIGASPSEDEAVWFWLGFERTIELDHFLEAIDDECHKSRVWKDRIPFKPSFILGQGFEPQKLPDLEIKSQFKGFKVRGFALYESRPGAQGPTYHQLRKFTLRS